MTVITYHLRFDHLYTNQQLAEASSITIKKREWTTLPSLKPFSVKNISLLQFERSKSFQQIPNTQLQELQFILQVTDSVVSYILTVCTVCAKINLIK